MLKPRTWLVATFCAVLASVLIYPLDAENGLWNGDCEPISQTNSIPSPGGNLDAIILHRACAGGFGSGSETYFIKVHRTGIGAADDGLNIFEAERYLPDVAWSASTRLVITIRLMSDISLSLHKAYDVNVTYRISDSLQPGQVEKEIDAYEARAKQAIRERKSTFTGNPTTDPQALDEAVSRWRSQYAKFRSWAASNAENGPR